MAAPILNIEDTKLQITFGRDSINEEQQDSIPKECKAIIALSDDETGFIMWSNNMISEDVSNVGSSLDYFEFHDMPEDGGVYFFEGVVVAGAPDWESGYVDDWSYRGKFVRLDVCMPDHGPILDY
jgi:hypothetical protein